MHMCIIIYIHIRPLHDGLPGAALQPVGPGTLEGAVYRVGVAGIYMMHNQHIHVSHIYVNSNLCTCVHELI